MASVDPVTMQAQQEIGAKIRQYRTQRGLSMDDLGKLIGHTRESVRKIEMGAQMPGFDTAMRLAAVFRVSTEDIQPSDWRKLYDPLSSVALLAARAAGKQQTGRVAKSGRRPKYQGKRTTGRRSATSVLQNRPNNQRKQVA